MSENFKELELKNFNEEKKIDFIKKYCVAGKQVELPGLLEENFYINNLVHI